MSSYSLPGTARLKTVGALWRYHSQNVTIHAAHHYRNAYLKTVRDLGVFGIETLRGKTVLDLGCGQRYPFSLLATGAGARVVALDVTSIEPRLSVAGIVRSSRRNGPLRAAKSAVRSVIFDRRYYGELERLSGVSREAANGVSFVWSDRLSVRIHSNRSSSTWWSPSRFLSTSETCLWWSRKSAAC